MSPGPEGGAPSPKVTLVVAGPGSSVTLPGVLVSEIAQSLADSYEVRRLEMDATQTFGLGLDRAPSLRSIQSVEFDVVRVPAVLPRRARLRMIEQSLVGVSAVVTVLWPGIDPTSMAMLGREARLRGIPVAVLLARVDGATAIRDIAAKDLEGVDLVLTGDTADVTVLKGIVPAVRAHPALNFAPRPTRAVDVIVAFIPPEGEDVLRSVVTAFDAIPEAWIERYRLHVITRLPATSLGPIVDASFYREAIELTNSVLDDEQVGDVCSRAAAVMIADPIYESRAFTTSAAAGLPVVLVSSDSLPNVPSGYLGTLVARAGRPVSIHVAMTHALRLAHVAIPNYAGWRGLLDELAMDVAKSVVTGPFGATSA